MDGNELGNTEFVDELGNTGALLNKESMDRSELSDELWAPHSADGFLGGGGRDVGFFGGQVSQGHNFRGQRALRGPETANNRNEGAIVILAFGGCALLCPSKFCGTSE